MTDVASLPPAPPAPSGRISPALIAWCVGLLLILGTGVRVTQCLTLPAMSGDIYRQILTGLMIQEDGWGAASQPLTDWAPASAEIAAWAGHPYNYPPLPLLFFRVVATLGPSALLVKSLLTACEALNTWLVFRLTGDHLIAAVYWCLPVSIWWVSREGNIEPMQNLFVLLALVGLRTARPWAIAAWVAAGQTKVSAIFLAPVFFARWWRSENRWAAAGWAVCATLPFVVALFYWPVLSQTLSTAHWEVTFNQWHWRALFDPRFGGWGTLPLLLWMRLATVALAVAMIVLAVRRRLAWDEAGSVLLFLLASATMGVFQGWYFCALLPFVLISGGRGQRLLLIALVQLCEPLSVYQLFVRPIGWGTHPAAITSAGQLITKP